ncbi:anhydro-N-acetylmuramic acid kinase [Planctomycetes bacterium Pan216]|uniref:Anhydro-N-acetylmuramic acid kinase n=1 Tax=Kolteria novifilia TaxID=2527975 RepID=A0A518B1C9_9BACT|nr:anhydro-N-acetylmuramic acid kinase [Planctomycetes bacterium Pan216]
MDTQIVLETERLILRPFVESDAESLHRVFSDPVAMKHYPSPLDLEGTRAWIERNQKRYEEDGVGLWAMVRKVTGSVIGDCGLTIQSVEGTGELEIGFHVLRTLWGRGFATEAATACRDYAFEVLERDRVISWMCPRNIPSRYVAERIGMSFEKEVINATGAERVVYALSREQWGRLTAERSTDACDNVLNL